VAQLNDEFGDLLVDGAIERTEPLRAEVSDADKLDLPRIALRFNVRRGARFRDMIRALNAFETAPPLDPAEDGPPPPGTPGTPGEPSSFSSG
jgi:hypothetical protein